MTAFESTAPFYSRYRVPYPDSLLAQLKLDANLGPVSTVLDLASGPGRFGLALASSVHEVIAVDVEPEMLEEGERVARRLGIGNVRWILGRVEEVAIEAGSIDLVTIGEAFHRLEQGAVLRRIGQWLKAGGCVAIGGCFGVQFGDEQWQASLRRAMEQWEGAAAAPSPGNAAALSRGIARDTGQLIEAGFRGVVNRQFSDSRTWTRDSILGHLHSTSRYSLSALGEELEGFRNAVLGALGTDESTQFRQDVSCGYSVGWKG